MAPLPVPGPELSPRTDAVSRYDAVQLFLARARAARPEFDIDDANAVGIARVCRRLDGMPLALDWPRPAYGRCRPTRSPSGSTTGSGSSP